MTAHLSAEAAAAIELYLLEQGPLRIEHTESGVRLVAKQEVRLRLKSADELRADGYAAGVQAARQAVAGMENALGYPASDFDHIKEDALDLIDALREDQ